MLGDAAQLRVHALCCAVAGCAPSTTGLRDCQRTAPADAASAPPAAPPSQTWAGKEENWAAAQDILGKLAKANSEAQLGQFKGPHPVPGGGRILQALRTGGAGK